MILFVYVLYVLFNILCLCLILYLYKFELNRPDLKSAVVEIFKISTFMPLSFGLNIFYSRNYM